MVVRIQSEPFFPGEELGKLQAARIDAGAAVCFVGAVRSDASRPLLSMTIEHYPGMTEAAIEGFVAQARRRWPILDCLVIHRFGELAPGDNIVMVSVLAAHRSDAFQAADFLMDYLKSRAPFWKRENTAAGSDWVAARPEDEESFNRWQQ